MKTKLSVIRAMAKSLAQTETKEQAAMRGFGEFCNAIGLNIDDWKKYRSAKQDYLRRKGRKKDEVWRCNPSAWEALAWVKLERPPIV
jgi:hypothetical protein